jgi:hypothetical protein
MTTNPRRELVALKQKLHGLTSTDSDLQAAILSTRAAIETVKDHPEMDSFILTVQRRVAAIIAQIKKK